MTATAGGPRSMLQIRRESVAPDIVVLHLIGRVAMGRPCQEIEAHIDELIQQKAHKVVLNFSEVQRMDSTGFGTLVLCAGKFRKAGGDLRVAGAKGIVEEIAHTSNIPRIIPFYTSLQEALASFAAPA
ncbi:MAG TPA: STAS domain-containing protein [Terriglobales bacterium]|jgi:anti-sigma B factor antagonist|nr:STAS domain-containing protein [Terriglobales bacterium]